MKDNNFLIFLKRPPKWFMTLAFLLTAIFAGGSLVLLLLNLGERFYSYIVYAFAGTFLAYAVYLIVILAPKMKKFYLETIKKYKFTRKVYEDYKFRTVVFSSSSLFINFCFGAFEIFIGVLSKSIWYGALGLYHLILSFARFGIVYRYHKQSKTKEISFERELKTYKNTGICILIFNLALAGAIVQMIFSRRAFEYAGLMIFAIAAYAFYKLTVSIIGIFKARKNNDLNTQSLRNLNLTDAMVSLYALQTALIATFSSESGSNVEVLNILTGVAVTILSVGVGIYMIVKSKKENDKINFERNQIIKKIRKKEED